MLIFGIPAEVAQCVACKTWRSKRALRQIHTTLGGMYYCCPECDEEKFEVTLRVQLNGTQNPEVVV